MYVSKKDVDTMHELIAFVEGQIDAVEDEEYWFDFLHRTKKLSDKMLKVHEAQNFKQLVQKQVRRLTNERK